MKFSAKTRVLALAVGCASLGAGASAIANAGAASGRHANARNQARAYGYRHAGFRHAGLRHGFGFAAGAVHGELVVHGGSGFVTETFDRGAVKSVSGDQLTVTDGTANATYKDVTLTIPAGARIRNNGAKAALSSLKAGERVVVVQAPKRTLVNAHTPRSKSTGSTTSGSAKGA